MRTNMFRPEKRNGVRGTFVAKSSLRSNMKEMKKLKLLYWILQLIKDSNRGKISLECEFIDGFFQVPTRRHQCVYYLELKFWKSSWY